MSAISIIGAGLSGTLLAILLAKRGVEVDLYERRPDMRKVKMSAGRSINLALSQRGIKALKRVGMNDYILSEAVPMKGRFIHKHDGSTVLQAYSGREGLHINSVSRGGLNIALLNQAESFSNIKMHFNMKCTAYDYKTNAIKFYNEESKQEETKIAKHVIGADGSASAIRMAMFDTSVLKRFDFEQKYLESGYKELCIPAAEDGSHQIEKNVLHIWPRGNFMMIALANFDGSFTCTLFMPFDGKNGFDDLDTVEKVKTFFDDQFPDAVRMMPTLVEDFFANPTGALATVKCNPWNVKDNTLLIGDAAHAVVPFYGQGMNASFEDCVAIDDAIEKHGLNWAKVFNEVASIRKINGDAIGDLAVENYVEMRSSVINPTFVLKRQIEFELEKRYEDFNSKYSMVTFRDDIPYITAKQRGERQDDFLMKYCSKFESVDDVNLEELYYSLKRLE